MVGMWNKAIELASRIRDARTITVFLGLFVVMSLFYAIRKRSRVAWILPPTILVLGIASLTAETYLASRGLYHIRIVVLDQDREPIDDAQITSSIGGEIKKGERNWELDIRPQSKPSDGRVTFYASIGNSYLSGESTAILGKDYHPLVKIQLRPVPSTTLRGYVIDDRGRSVAGAVVSIPGYPKELGTTDQMGSFSIDSHAARNQFITVRAEKGDLRAEQLVIVGGTVEIILRKP
jgi:hypothetical protein